MVESLLDGIWGVLKGSWGVLDYSLLGSQPASSRLATVWPRSSDPRSLVAEIAEPCLSVSLQTRSLRPARNPEVQTNQFKCGSECS